MENHGYIWEPFILVLENHGHYSLFESQNWEPPVINVTLMIPPNTAAGLMMMHFNKSASSDITYLLTLLLASELTHFLSCIWMCRLSLEQMRCNKYVEYKKREYELKLGAFFWWACLSVEEGFLFIMTKWSLKTEPTCKDKENKKGYTSTTELQLPKCPKLSSPPPAKTATEPSLWYLTTSEFAVSVSVIRLMNAIYLFFWKKNSQQFIYLRMYQSNFHNTYVDTNQYLKKKKINNDNNY